MPRVPFVPSVALESGGMVPVQAPSVQPMEDFTGRQIAQTGEAMMRLGAGAIDVANVQRREQAMEEEAKAKEEAIRQRRQAQLDDAVTAQAANQLMGVLDDADVAHNQMVGLQASQGLPGLEENTIKAIQKIRDGLQNDVQRQQFDLYASEKYRAKSTQWRKRGDDELGKFRIAEFGKLSENSARDAASYAEEALQDPQTWAEKYGLKTPGARPTAASAAPSSYDLNKGLAISYANKVADSKGYPEGSAQRKELVDGALQSVHQQSMDRFLGGYNFANAQKYLEKFKDEIPQDSQIKYGKIINDGYIDQIAANYVETHIKNGGDFPSFDAALLHGVADGSINPKVADAARKRAKDIYDSEKSARAEYDNKIVDTAKAGFLSGQFKTVDDIRKNKQLWDALSLMQGDKIDDLRKWNANQFDTNIVGQLEVWKAMGSPMQIAGGQLPRMVDVDPQVFYNTFNTLIPENTMKSYINDIQTAKGKKVDAIEKYYLDKLDNFSVDAGLKERATDSNGDKIIYKFKNATQNMPIFERIANLTRSMMQDFESKPGGRRMEYKDIDAMFDALRANKNTSDGWFSSTTTYLVTMPQEEQRNFKVKTPKGELIPISRLRGVEEYFKDPTSIDRTPFGNIMQQLDEQQKARPKDPRNYARTPFGDINWQNVANAYFDRYGDPSMETPEFSAMIQEGVAINPSIMSFISKAASDEDIKKARQQLIELNEGNEKALQYIDSWSKRSSKQTEERRRYPSIYYGGY